MYNPSNYKVGPRGGVYTVDFDGTRHYLDREQARRYIAELTAGRSSAGTATKSRLVSINPGDKDYGERSSQSIASEESDWNRWAWCFCFAGLAALAGLGHSWFWSFFCGVPAISCAVPTPRG